MKKKYKELKYKSIDCALKKQREIKKLYGHIPEIFKVINPKTGNIFYSVIKPMGLKKI